MNDRELTKEIVIRPSSTLLWISIMAGPTAWAICLESRFALVGWACLHQCAWVLNLIGATALVAALAGALLGWSAFTRLDRDAHRARFMAISGVIISGFFVIAVLANSIPTLFLHPCD
jgi:predicted membrane protein